MKKVLKIDIGRFLFEAYDDRITFVDHIRGAMDISDFSIEQLQHIMSNLKRVGYKPEVIEVKK